MFNALVFRKGIYLSALLFIVNLSLSAQCSAPSSIWLNSGQTPTSLPFAWSNGSGATNYQLYYWENANPGDKTIVDNFSPSPKTLTGLKQFTNYTVQIRSKCAGNTTSPWSTTVTYLTSSASGSCNIPTGVAATGSSSSITVSWTSAGSHTVRYRAGTSGDWIIPANGLNISSSPFTIPGLAVGSYQIQLKSNCTATSSSYVQTTATVGGGSSITISYTAGSGVDIPSGIIGINRNHLQMDVNAYNATTFNSMLDQYGAITPIFGNGRKLYRFGGSQSEGSTDANTSIPGWHWNTNYGVGTWALRYDDYQYPNAYYLKELERLNSDIIMNINFGSGTSDEAKAAVEYLKNVGKLPLLKGVLIGNENSDNLSEKGHEKACHPTTYGLNAKDYAQKIHQIDPNIKVGLVCGANSGMAFANWVANGTCPVVGTVSTRENVRLILKEVKNDADFINLHNYVSYPLGNVDEYFQQAPTECRIGGVRATDDQMSKLIMASNTFANTKINEAKLGIQDAFNEGNISSVDKVKIYNTEYFTHLAVKGPNNGNFGDIVDKRPNITNGILEAMYTADNIITAVNQNIQAAINFAYFHADAVDLSDNLLFTYNTTTPKAVFYVHKMVAERLGNQKFSATDSGIPTETAQHLDNVVGAGFGDGQSSVYKKLAYSVTKKADGTMVVLILNRSTDAMTINFDPGSGYGTSNANLYRIYGTNGFASKILTSNSTINIDNVSTPLTSVNLSAVPINATSINILEIPPITPVSKADFVFLKAPSLTSAPVNAGASVAISIPIGAVKNIGNSNAATSTIKAEILSSSGSSLVSATASLASLNTGATNTAAVNINLTVPAGTATGYYAVKITANASGAPIPEHSTINNFTYGTISVSNTSCTLTVNSGNAIPNVPATASSTLNIPVSFAPAGSNWSASVSGSPVFTHLNAANNNLPISNSTATSVSLYYDANTGAQRSNTVTFTSSCGQVVSLTITQLAGGGSCTTSPDCANGGNDAILSACPGGNISATILSGSKIEYIKIFNSNYSTTWWLCNNNSSLPCSVGAIPPVSLVPGVYHIEYKYTEGTLSCFTNNINVPSALFGNNSDREDVKSEHDDEKTFVFDASKMLLFPNPSNGMLNVALDLPGGRNVILRILDPLGMEIKSIRFDSGPGAVYQFDVNTLPGGIYFLEASTGDQKGIKRFVKQ